MVNGANNMMWEADGGIGWSKEGKTIEAAIRVRSPVFLFFSQKTNSSVNISLEHKS